MKEVLTSLISNVSLLIVFGMMANGFVVRRDRHELISELFCGLFIGFISIALMVTPWQMAPGVIFDARSVLLSVSALFFGFFPVLIGGLIATAFRLVLGGRGTLAGVLIIASSSFIGLVWHYYQLNREGRCGLLSLSIMGFTVHLVLLLILTVIVPRDLGEEALRRVGVPVVVVYSVAVVLFGWLLQRQWVLMDAEHKLHKSDAQLARSEVIARLGHWEYSPGTKKYIFSPGGQAILGLNDKESVSSAEFLSLLLPAHRVSLGELMQNAVNDQSAFDSEYELVRQDDQRVIHIHAMGEYDAKNGMVYGVIYDDTGRKRSLATLRRGKERLAVTLSSIADGVISTNIAGRITLMNRAAEELTGWVLCDAHSRKLCEVFRVVNLRTRAQLPDPAESVIQRGERVELEGDAVLITQEGRELIVSASASPIFDAKSAAIGVVLVFRDCTMKHKMAEHLQQSEKLSALGSLAGGIAHDFNNLLSGVFGYVDLARLTCSDEEALDYLDKAMKAFDRGKALTQQLLTFSKGGAPERRLARVDRVVRDCCTFAMSGSKSCLGLSVADDLWPCKYDQHQIAQVLDNLVINAKQSMPHGGVVQVSAVNVSLSSRDVIGLDEGCYVQIDVADQGVGIPAEAIPSIFNPFFSTKATGSGLGLATSYSIVEKHGGMITVTSTEGEGTQFSVYLPAWPDLALDSELEMTGNGAAESVDQGLGLRVLVMDDEDYVRDIVEKMLNRMGCAAECCVDGQSMLVTFQKGIDEDTAFDVVLMDLTIPGGMGGKDAIVELRKLDTDVAAFASSGYSDDPVMADPEQFGFTGSIGKPFRRTELAGLLAGLVADTKKAGKIPA